MQYEFKGKSLTEAVAQAFGSTVVAPHQKQNFTIARGLIQTDLHTVDRGVFARVGRGL